MPCAAGGNALPRACLAVFFSSLSLHSCLCLRGALPVALDALRTARCYRACLSRMLRLLPLPRGTVAAAAPH